MPTFTHNVTTERKTSIYLNEAELVELIEGALRLHYGPEAEFPTLSTHDVDWDVSQGALVNGVTVHWVEITHS